MRKIWDKFVKWLLSIPVDRRLHFVFGFGIAVFSNIALCMGPLCFVPALFCAFGKEFFDEWTGGEFDWKDFLATCIGGVLPVLFCLVHIAIFKCWH